MITLAKDLEKLSPGDAAAVRIACLFDCYYNVLPSVQFWKQTDINGEVLAYISKSENNITLFAEKNADFEELKSFIFKTGGRLFCGGDNLRSLNTGLYSRCGEELIFKGNGIKDSGFTDNPDMKSLHAALSKEFETADYETFYADVFYRRRKARIHFSTYQEDGKTAASAMTTAESENCAVIGGVFTDIDRRGEGLGKRAVLSICEKLSDKTVLVCARDADVVGFYKKCGFESHGLWTETEIY